MVSERVKPYCRLCVESFNKKYVKLPNRPEAVDGGTRKSVGNGADKITREETIRLDDPPTAYAAMERAQTSERGGIVWRHIRDVMLK